jgi:CHAT domain-containing protein
MRQKLYPKGRFPDGHPLLAAGLNNLGGLLKAQGEYARAEPFLRDALAVYEAQLRNFAELKAEAEALNRLAEFPLTRDTFLTVSRHLPPRAEHYEPVWQQKAFLTRIFERRHLDTLAGSADDETRALARELRGARERLARLTVVPLPDPKAHAERLQKLTEEKEEAEQKLARRLSVAAPAGKQDAVTPDGLLRALPPDAAFVDLLRYRSIDQDPKVPGRKGETWTHRYVAFVLRKGQPVQRVELGEAEPIERALQQWRREISDWRPDRKATRGGADARLSELVWQPLTRHIPADTATVYLCPDAALTALPWAALPGRTRGKVLLEEHALALVPHGPWLLERLRAKPDKERPGALLALGAVAYGRAPSGGARALPADLVAAAKTRGGWRAAWDDLKATEHELEQVIARAGRREVIVRKGADAGLAQVYRDLEQARYAHLATHGFFDDRGTRSVLQLSEDDYRRGRRGERVGAGLRSPLLLSGLVLAGANRKEQGKPETWADDGGILLGEDIVGRDLHQMELAVLSACETGLGDVAGGEGVFGLQRAFHVAGCKNVVASLWQVDDEATAALMNLFYARLWHLDPAKRLPPLEALRQAQLALYRQPDLLAQFAKGEVRGPKADKVVKIEDYAPPRPEEVKAGEKKAHPKQWAAFVLSGDGR